MIINESTRDPRENRTRLVPGLTASESIYIQSAIRATEGETISGSKSFRPITAIVAIGVMFVVSETPHQEVLFEQIRIGPYGLLNESYMVIQTQSAWSELWNESHRHPFANVSTETPPTPSIDFDNSTVLAVFMGATSPGHSIEIGRVERASSGEITVHVYETQPDPFLSYPGVISYPKKVVVCEKLWGEIHFVEHQS